MGSRSKYSVHNYRVKVRAREDIEFHQLDRLHRFPIPERDGAPRYAPWYWMRRKRRARRRKR
jgi:hypothetical protein